MTDTKIKPVGKISSVSKFGAYLVIWYHDQPIAGTLLYDEAALEAARQGGFAECSKGVDAFTDATNKEVRELRAKLKLATDALERIQLNLYTDTSDEVSAIAKTAIDAIQKAGT